MTTILVRIAAYLLLVSFGTGLWCMAILRNYIDEEKIRAEPRISEVLRDWLLPERVLTENGKKIRKISRGSITLAFLLFLAICIATMYFNSG